MPSPSDSSFSLTGRTSRSLSQLRLHRAWTHILLALGFMQVILGVLIVTFSLVTASITPNMKIKHSCPSWAGFSLAVSGLISCISWKKPFTLVVTALTLLSALSVMLNLAGSILSCQNGQLVKSFNSCKKENNWCICCHPALQPEVPSSCGELEKLVLLHVFLHIWESRPSRLPSPLSRGYLFMPGPLNLVVLAPHRSTSVNLECFSPPDTMLQSMIECEEFVPPVPPPPYYPPEYTCSSETDAQSITYNGSMDSPIPLYPTDFPPSYESVMGIREDSQATLYDVQANENSTHSVSDRIGSTGHSANEDSSPSEDSVLLDVQGSVRSVDYVLYRSIQRSRADYCLSVDCGQCGHHQHSPTLSLQGPFEAVAIPRIKEGRSFSCSTPSSCQDPPSHVGSGTTRSCNRLESIGGVVGPCFPELRVKGKVPRGRHQSQSSGCSFHHSSPCQTLDCPHRRYSENTRPKMLCTNETPRLVIRSHSDPGIASLLQTDFGDVDYRKGLEEDDAALLSADAAAVCAEAGPHRRRPPISPLLLRTGSLGKNPVLLTHRTLQRLSRSGALSLGDLKGGRNTRLFVARFLNCSRRSLKEGSSNGKQPLKSPFPLDSERRQSGISMQSCGDLSSTSSLRRLLSTSRRGNQRPHSLNDSRKESAV
ncbi:protein ENTREP3 isoform X2 [Hyperolius riggenbachi]|uniref:protein ENTREP3 isoform X2 n=1 Tax=Hyperolius riggenbachi TaxID=752182 RepID=UPI0035A3A56F